MAEVNDMDLVREYADRNSESAFGELVHRHINLVYSVALRFTDHPQDAQDVTQAVFIILAQKSANLRAKIILTGWLYETARFTAMRFLRTKASRQLREQEAYMSTLNDSNSESIWRQVAPLLEEAMTRLSEKERTLVALRFFENKSTAETAALLGIQEWAAHKRTARALEKLRKLFMKRGVASTTAIIAGAISANSVQAAPAVLAKTAIAVAFAKGTTASSSTLTLIKGALKIMAWTKAKTATVVGVVVLLVAGTTISVVKTRHGETQKVALIEEMPVKEQMSAMKMSVFPAIMNFAQAHQDELPKSLADLKPFLTVSLNEVDDEHWEILQSGRVTPEFVRQRNLILLQQKNVPPEKPKIIVYADGHIECKK